MNSKNLFTSAMWIWFVRPAKNDGRLGWMETEKEFGKNILSVRLDNDDDDIAIINYHISCHVTRTFFTNKKKLLQKSPNV